MMSFKRKMDAWQVISFVILALYALFLVLPLFQLLRSSVINDEGQFTWEFFQRFFGRETYYGTLFNSFKVACAVTVSSLVVGILFSYLPQHYRIISRRTSQGISPYFILLGTISGTCAFANILVLPASRADVACCGQVSTFECFAGMLGIAQVGVQWSCFFAM